MSAPILVSGLGALGPWGEGAEALWADWQAALAEGLPAWAGEAEGPWGAGGQPWPVAGVALPDAKARLGPRVARALDRVGAMTALGADGALAASGLPPGPEVGLVLGTAFAGLGTVVGFFQERLREGPRFVTAGTFGNVVMNAPASQVAMRHDLQALNATASSGHAAGADALGLALGYLREGRAAALLAGGVEEQSPVVQGHLAATGQPGLRGEAVAFLALEGPAALAARGAQPLAVLAGHGAAFHPGAPLGAAPSAAVAERAVLAALKAAGVGPEAVGLVVGGAWDAASQAAEDAALAALGVAAPVWRAKARWGESVGAYGAVGAALAALAVAQPGGPAWALVHAFGPSGHHGVLVLGRAA